MMACLVEVFQVERVVPDLIFRWCIELCRSVLEFNGKDDRADQQDNVDSSTHSWDAEFEQNRSFESDQLFAQDLYFCEPRSALVEQDIEAAILNEPSKNSFGIVSQELRNRSPVPRACSGS